MGTREPRIGVIGAGGRGGLAGHAHQPENGVRLVAGADVRDEALARFRERYGEDVLTTRNCRELLACPDIDAVFICTPDWLHEQMAVDALEAGKAVYLEKPMAITVMGCDRQLAAADSQGHESGH